MLFVSKRFIEDNGIMTGTENNTEGCTKFIFVDRLLIHIVCNHFILVIAVHVRINLVYKYQSPGKIK